MLANANGLFEAILVWLPGRMTSIYRLFAVKGLPPILLLAWLPIKELIEILPPPDPSPERRPELCVSLGFDFDCPLAAPC